MDAVEFRNKVIDLYDKSEEFGVWLSHELEQWANYEHDARANNAKQNFASSDFDSTNEYLDWLVKNVPAISLEPILSPRRFPLPDRRRLVECEQAVVTACMFNLHPEGRPNIRPNSQVALMRFELMCLDVSFDHLSSISDASFDCFWGKIARRFPKLDHAIADSQTKSLETIESPDDIVARELLIGWTEICQTLRRPDPEKESTHKQIKSLNEKYGGPTCIGKKGKSPKVEKLRLIDWWNRLSENFRTEQEESVSEYPDLSTSPYGKTGTTAHDIQGEIRSFRCDTGTSRKNNEENSDE
jgi:hypothetical protein